MKKNLLSILILSLLVVNIVMTAIMLMNWKRYCSAVAKPVRAASRTSFQLIRSARKRSAPRRRRMWLTAMASIKTAPTTVE